MANPRARPELQRRHRGADEGRSDLKAFRLALARTPFKAGLWKLGRVVEEGRGRLRLRQSLRFPSAFISRTTVESRSRLQRTQPSVFMIAAPRSLVRKSRNRLACGSASWASTTLTSRQIVRPSDSFTISALSGEGSVLRYYGDTPVFTNSPRGDIALRP